MRNKTILGFLGTLFAGLLIVIGSAIAAGRIPNPLPIFQPKTPAGPRPAEILYLSPTNGQTEIWRAAVDGSNARMLTHASGKIISYSVSHSGNMVTFSSENNQGGSDLWTVTRDGSDQKVLVRCGIARCETPEWSPDEKEIAFVSDAPLTSETDRLPRLWLVDVKSGQSHPLDNDPLIQASAVSWSPQGNHLAFYDPSAKGIRVRDMTSGAEILIATNIPSAGSWSPDGQKLVFNLEENSSGFAFMKIYSFDLSTGKSQLFLGLDAEDASDYSLPVYSPDGEWLAFGQRRLPGSPSKQFWLIRPDGKDAKAVTNDNSYTNASFSWSPDSRAVLFQRFAFGSSQNAPDVMLWNQVTGQTTLIARNAAMPKWLP